MARLGYETKCDKCKSIFERYSHLLVVGRTSLSTAVAVDVDIATDVVGELGDVAKTPINRPCCQLTLWTFVH